jgi:hypothetical protein
MKRTYKQHNEENVTGNKTVKTDFTQMQQYVKQLEAQIKLLGETIRASRAIT